MEVGQQTCQPPALCASASNVNFSPSGTDDSTREWRSSPSVDMTSLPRVDSNMSLRHTPIIRAMAQMESEWNQRKRKYVSGEAHISFSRRFLINASDEAIRSKSDCGFITSYTQNGRALGVQKAQPSRERCYIPCCRQSASYACGIPTHREY